MLVKINSSSSIQSRSRFHPIIKYPEKTERPEILERNDKIVKIETLERRNESISSLSSYQSDNRFELYNYEYNKFGKKKLTPFFDGVFADTYHKIVDMPPYLNTQIQNSIIYLKVFII